MECGRRLSFGLSDAKLSSGAPLPSLAFHCQLISQAPTCEIMQRAIPGRLAGWQKAQTWDRWGQMGRPRCAAQWAGTGPAGCWHWRPTSPRSAPAGPEDGPASGCPGAARRGQRPLRWPHWGPPHWRQGPLTLAGGVQMRTPGCLPAAHPPRHPSPSRLRKHQECQYDPAK